MKKSASPSALLLFLFASTALYAQTGIDLKLPDPPATTFNEVSVKHDVAFNGWLFAGVNSTSPAGDFLDILRSKDGGHTWTRISAATSENSDTLLISSFDLVVAGTDTANLWLYLVFIAHNLSDGNYQVGLYKINASSDNINGSLLYSQTTTNTLVDAAIATDYRFPAVGANPYSVAFVYSVGAAAADSIKYVASVDGGNTFSVAQTVALTGFYFRNVDIAYGKSASASNGRYFVAWERMIYGRSDRNGNIYTSRNQSSISGPFITPVNLDSLDIGTAGVCRNPSIAVQYNNTDNDSGSVTAIVLAERDYQGTATDYDVLGFYNKVAHVTSNWTTFAMVNSARMEKQANITFEPDSNKFHATYLDSTDLQLPSLTNDVNMNNPADWLFVHINYADPGNVKGNPQPQVRINPLNQKATFTWIKNESGQGDAYFDADAQPVFANISDLFCSGATYSFNGQILTSAGIYYDTLTAASGVDSIVRLTLLALAAPQPTVTESNQLLTTEAYSSYQWQLNGNDIPLATSQTYYATESGAYTVEVTNSSGCSGTSAPIGVIVSGIEEARAYGISIYPNPVNHLLHLDMGLNKNVSVTISDAAGKNVFSTQLTGMKTLDVKHFASGVYSILMIMESKTVSVKMIKE